MSNLKFSYKVNRKVIIDPKLTQGKMMIVGDVEEYEKTDEEIKVNLRLFDDLPKELEETILKNPACLHIIENLTIPDKPLIIPSRPKLDLGIDTLHTP